MSNEATSAFLALAYSGIAFVIAGNKKTVELSECLLFLVHSCKLQAQKLLF